MGTPGRTRIDPWPRPWIEEIEDAELFIYPGSGHLFADPDSGDYDEQAAGLLKKRTLAFLRRVE